MPTTDYTFGMPVLKWRFGLVRLASGGEGTITNPPILSALTVDYVQVPVRATEAGVVTNPTSLVVKLAFTTPGTAPVSGDWKTGSWDTAIGGTYLAQVLVGPGQNVLGKGVYSVWVQVVDSPEVPVVRVGSLQVV